MGMIDSPLRSPGCRGYTALQTSVSFTCPCFVAAVLDLDYTIGCGNSPARSFAEEKTQRLVLYKRAWRRTWSRGSGSFGGGRGARQTARRISKRVTSRRQRTFAMT